MGSMTWLGPTMLAATGSGPAWELSAVVIAWGAATWWVALRLTRAGSSTTRRAHPAGGADRSAHPTVRRTNPRRPKRASTEVDSARARRTTPAAIVGIDGVSAARSPSLT